jgi:hypothetical protein
LRKLRVWVRLKPDEPEYLVTRKREDVIQ